MEDRELLDRIRRGDREAFDWAFRAYYALLVGAAESLVRSRAVAEELVQDVMLTLWQKRESLFVDDSVRAYLYKATRNRALNHLRHERVEKRSAPFLAEAPSIAPSAPAQLANAEIASAITAALEHLPARCREVFELSRAQNLKYSEIASTLGISVKTVEAQMGKALRILRERLADWLPPSDG